MRNPALRPIMVLLSSSGFPVVAASRSGLIVADTLVIAITWFTLYRHGRMVPKQSLGYTVLRDGKLCSLCAMIVGHDVTVVLICSI